MNEWDEKIYRDSLARDLCPGGFEDQEAFTIGAHWQRKALMSDEGVIERAARAWSATCEAGRAGPGYRDAWRAALMAAIEGDE